MKHAADLLMVMSKEASNNKNPPETRQACKECADWFKAFLAVPVKPKMQRVPFGFSFIALCGMCGEELTSDENTCEHCGSTIAWDKI